MKAGVVGSKRKLGTRTEQCSESTGARTFKKSAKRINWSQREAACFLSFKISKPLFKTSNDNYPKVEHIEFLHPQAGTGRDHLPGAGASARPCHTSG